MFAVINFFVHTQKRITVQQIMSSIVRFISLHCYQKWQKCLSTCVERGNFATVYV